jgi:queuine tRNA-ribosyltransferase
VRECCFRIDAREGRARAGALLTARGEVSTPAFVPLASTATVKGLHSSEVAALGYEMVLANTYHLFIQPGAEAIAALGGLHEFMGWRRAIVTDSGGYQVFSMGHGSVADEIKRRQEPRQSMVLSVTEAGVRFRSYLDGSERFMGPETSMEVQAALGSDVALAFDECTPFHASRDYTRKAMERTHRWLDRCVAWHAEHAAPGQLLFGIVQGGVHRDLRAESAARIAAAPVDGVAVGGSLGRDKAQMLQVVEWSLADLPDERPRHLLGIGDVDDVLEAVAAGVDLFDCATPTRLARHGTALVAQPATRWRLDLAKPAHRRDPRPIAAGCPCPACREHSRGYLHYLVRAGELTAKRLITLHNLTFMAALMRGVRSAIEAGRLRAYAVAVTRGDAPYAADLPAAASAPAAGEGA